MNKKVQPKATMPIEFYEQLASPRATTPYLVVNSDKMRPYLSYLLTAAIGLLLLVLVAVKASALIEQRPQVPTLDTSKTISLQPVQTASIPISGVPVSAVRNLQYGKTIEEFQVVKPIEQYQGTMGTQPTGFRLNDSPFNQSIEYLQGSTSGPATPAFR